MRTCNEYEFNLAIYRAIAEYAQMAFDDVVCQPGKYSVSDITKNWETAKHGNSMNFALGFNREEIVKIEVGSFKAEMPVKHIFDILLSYEKATGIKKSDKAVFVREEISDVIGSFVMPEDIKGISACVGNDEIKPVLTYVAVDFEKGYVVGTDGQIMGVAKIGETERKEECPNTVLLDPKFAKKCAGKKVHISKDYARCGDDACRLDCDLVYPKWRAIKAMFSEKNHIELNGRFKELKKAFALYGKTDYKDRAIIASDNKNGCIQISAFDEYGDGDFKGQQNVEIEPKFKFLMLLSNNLIKRVPNADCMYFGELGDANPVVFKDGNALYLIMNCIGEGFACVLNDEHTNNLPFLDLIENKAEEAVEKEELYQIDIVKDFDGSYYAYVYCNQARITGIPEYVSYKVLKKSIKEVTGVILPNASELQWEKGFKGKEYATYECMGNVVSVQETEQWETEEDIYAVGNQVTHNKSGEHAIIVDVMEDNSAAPTSKLPLPP